MATSAPKKPSEMTFAEALTAAIDGPQPTVARPAKGHPMYPSEPARPAEGHPMSPKEDVDDEEIPESNLADFAGEPPAGEDDGFASAIEAALARTQKITESAKTAVSSTGEPAAKKGFEAAGSPLESPAEVADAAAEKRFSEAEAEVAFRAPAAPVVPEVDEATALKDFETTHGGSFDPNSSVDVDKMSRIKKARALNPKATPTQLALMIYRNQV